MSATDELRRMLDERGESWHKWPDDDSTTWQAYSNPHTATESMDGTLIVTGLTPEQAIEATLGRGECRNNAPTYLDFLCSECGFVHYRSDENDTGDRNEWHFCPNCGRKVVDG